jgi:hypothetical protein
LAMNGRSARYLSFSRHRGLPNLVETILIDSREVSGYLEIFLESKTSIVAAS